MSKIISQKRFIKEALEAHNRYRELHNAPLLEHDPNLSDLASDWADYLAANQMLQYRNADYNNQAVGENILRARSAYMTGDEVTDFWYDEEKNYDYKGKFSSSTGHFTQIVWKNTRKVGFAFAITDNGEFYVVVNYFPAGNIKNEFSENVLPIRGKESTYKHMEQPQTRNLISKNMNEVPTGRSSATPVSYEENRANPRNLSSGTLTGFDPVQSRFIQEALQTHNSCRAKHCVEPLTHNPELSKIAHEYAIYLAKIRTLKHSTNKYRNETIGENLAFAYDSRLDFYSGEKASMQWYDEIKDHNFNLDYQNGTGHFTQLVWKTTREVGFGVARANDGSFYAVANYYPAGNMIGTFVKNVPRPV